ncbi:Hypothetical predicted protein [Pelobates cultripes]|uniref:Uncharacterized protein n=1 Tax=Pelobates cultripes TaxID=61616 RepID=A0AAD1SIN0_PELCU|nr:Hypothetical predicted protein [Pelobates cultripes]
MPNHSVAPSDNESDDSCSILEGSLDSPLTRRDMRGFMREFKSHVAEELQKHLQLLHEGLTDLAMWTHEVETKMEDTITTVNSYDSAIQKLKEQIKSLDEAQEEHHPDQGYTRN